MKHSIEWLLHMEERAERLYKKASVEFRGKDPLSLLLKDLSFDERQHREALEKASRGIDAGALPEPLIYLDEATKGAIDRAFGAIEERLGKNSCTADEIVGFIVETEYSEWNDMFLYVLNTLRRAGRGFIAPAVLIQRHKRRIELFLEENHEFRGFLDKVRSLKSVWEEKILVVDDDDAIIDVLRAVLEKEGGVDSALNGAEALERLSQNYYAAIISDVEMPKMDGIEFYRKAVLSYPNIKGRFLFFTGSMDRGVLGFIRDNNLRFVRKPSNVREIKEAILRVLALR